MTDPGHPPTLADRILGLLVSDTPSPVASLYEMVSWVHGREGRYFSHDELVAALRELHRAGSIYSEGYAYGLMGWSSPGERALLLPDEADLLRAQQAYRETMNRLGSSPL